MANRIVLISDDSDFFDYLKLKLELRRSDELFCYNFDAIPEKLNFLEGALLIINSEGAREKTLDLIKIFRGSPVIVMAYNEDETYKKKCYRLGMSDFIPVMTSDSEFRARLIPILGVAALLEKNRQYRDILVRSNVMAKNNEVYIDYSSVIDNELIKINQESRNAVFSAISPGEKGKFLYQPGVIETVILNNIRKNDILMNYAPNKYFLLMYDTNLKDAQKFWRKITEKFPEKIYAGFSSITNQSRQQLINDVLNKLHEAIVSDKEIVKEKKLNEDIIASIQKSQSAYTNFKLYRQEFSQKLEQIIAPVFYQIQQKYMDRFMGINIEHSICDGSGTFRVKGKYFDSFFRITSPGLAKINVDITMNKSSEEVDTKRITIEPEEMERGLLNDLLEQFMTEVQNIYERGQLT